MDARTFNAGVMSQVNEHWSSCVLHFSDTEKTGPDLFKSRR